MNLIIFRNLNPPSHFNEAFHRFHFQELLGSVKIVVALLIKETFTPMTVQLIFRVFLNNQDRRVAALVTGTKHPFHPGS
jgi:hypothetical protein